MKKTQQDQIELIKYFNSAKKFADENEPIYAKCPNKGNPCFCTDDCHEVIGYRLKSTSPLMDLKEGSK